MVVYEDETLHFFINGIDQGLAATNVPNGVYGVIDLYGQAAKASIVHASGKCYFVFIFFLSRVCLEEKLSLCSNISQNLILENGLITKFTVRKLDSSQNLM